MPIIEHPIHIKIEDSANLWRYISFSKFESLLKEKALFFCRADKFSDPFECSVPKREADYRISEQKFQKIERAFRRFDSKYDKEIAKRKSDEMADLHKRVKIATTVNCWHINNNESDAMWQLYLKNNEGVAIKTNKIKLYKSLNKVTQNIGISKVRYIDYETGIWYNETEFPVDGYNLITPIIHKRLVFKHENELRLYHHNSDREKSNFWEKQSNHIGEFIPIEVNSLVEAVVFHPTSDYSIKDKIITLTKKYGYNFDFQESKMFNNPTY